jgi:hypothetical protein
LVEVFAGSSGQPATTGAIFVAVTNYGNGSQIGPSGLFSDPSVDGALTLTAVNGNAVSFVASDGTHGTFDLATKSFAAG